LVISSLGLVFHLRQKADSKFLLQWKKIITNVGGILMYNHHQKCILLLKTAFPPDGPGGMATLALSEASL
jgi:hypothetical protein